MNYIITNSKFYNNSKVYFILLLLLFFISPVIYSQNNNHKPPDPTEHHEVKDDNYIPVSRSSQGRSPAYSYSMSNIFTTQVNVDANGQNILGDAANEPSIAVDPTNHNIITIGWRQFNTVSSNFRQAGYGYTE